MWFDICFALDLQKYQNVFTQNLQKYQNVYHCGFENYPYLCIKKESLCRVLHLPK